MDQNSRGRDAGRAWWLAVLRTERDRRLAERRGRPITARNLRRLLARRIEQFGEMDDVGANKVRHIGFLAFGKGMELNPIDFDKAFKDLTGNMPFPWQSELFRLMSGGLESIPKRCDIPTGLGKTSVIAVWLLARRVCLSLPRRLVYVVNRRTVVDQTTDEVQKYKTQYPQLTISTLRGQFADNREWSADPSREAIICGTVDMIGSRLLFSGYGIGTKSRPLHAGFLGQDVLLVHDEAHLEPAFQKLIEDIVKEQKRCKEFGCFHVMELTATSRGEGEPFKLSDEDKKNETVKKRIHAAKKLHLQPVKDPKKLAEQIVGKALAFKDSGLAVLVFTRTVEDVLKVRDALANAELSVQTLTGTMRGKERDDLVKDKTFARFLPEPPNDAVMGTVYLVCTSAGEVGVNISADHLICDLSTFESMAQRFGRVNRFGKPTDTEIHVIHPADKDFDETNEYDQRRRRTLDLLNELSNDASPAALSSLDAEKRIAAFAPTPIILPTSDILFDAWALTTIKGKLPGRPEVEPYLHGLPTDWQPPETQVAWREEVSEITGELIEEYPPEDLLDEYPLKPHELLRDRSDRVHQKLGNIAKRWQGKIWLLDDDGSVEIVDLAEFAEKNGKERLQSKTVILPPAAGGLSSSGMLDGNSPAANDVADTCERKRVWNGDTWPDSMHEVVTIRFPGPEDDEDAEGKIWHWLRLANEGDRGTEKPVLWEVHVGYVERETAKIVDALPLSDGLKNALKQAAKYHDHGKRRALFQRVLGNTNPNIWLAKSGKKGNGVQEQYRHEFGSLLDIEKELESLKLGEHQDLVLHLIAAHHGRARPHFPFEEAFDPDRPQSDAERIACEVPRRFARLQRKYGRWGLAYLESLLRAGDWAASGNP